MQKGALIKTLMHRADTNSSTEQLEEEKRYVKEIWKNRLLPHASLFPKVFFDHQDSFLNLTSPESHFINDVFCLLEAFWAVEFCAFNISILFEIKIYLSSKLISFPANILKFQFLKLFFVTSLDEPNSDKSSFYSLKKHLMCLCVCINFCDCHFLNSSSLACNNIWQLNFFFFKSRRIIYSINFIIRILIVYN